jgi:hypothetical protein
MPKLPVYDSQVNAQVGGVEPASNWLPRERLDTGLPQALNKLAAEGNSVVSTYGQVQKQQDTEQRTIEGGNALGQLLKGVGEIQGRYAGSTAPDAPQQFQGEMTDLVNTTLEGVSEQNRAHVGAQLAHHVGDAVGGFNKQYGATQRQLGLSEVQDNMKTMAQSQVDNELAGDEQAAFAVMGSAHGYADRMEAFGRTDTKKGEATKKYDDMVKAVRFDKMLSINPLAVQEALQTPEGQEKYGVPPAGLIKAQNHAAEQVTKLQTATYQNLLNGIRNGQNPTEDQMSVLTGGQKGAIDNMVKSVGQTDNEPVRLAFGDKVIQLYNNATPANVENGKALYQDVLTSPGLSVPTKLKFLTDIQTKINGDQSLEGNQVHTFIEQIKGTSLSREQGLMFSNYIVDHPELIPPGTPWEKTQRIIMDAAYPFRQATVNSIMTKGTKKTMTNLEAAGAEFSVTPPAPAGFQPGMYKLKSGAVVPIRTQQDYNQQMGR